MTVRPYDLTRAKVKQGRRFGSFIRGFKYYIVAVSAKLIYVGLELFRRHDAWVMGDWEINYSGGFIRRGLVGEWARLCERALRVPRLVVVLIAQWSCYGFMIWSVWSLLKGLDWSLWMVLLVYSPATLSFTLFSVNRAMHKEILFLALLGAFVVKAGRWKSSSLYWIPFAMAGVVLTHEATAMYLPYLFCAIYLAYHSLSAAALAMVPSLIAFGAAVLYPGTVDQALSICLSVGGRDLDSAVCNGAIKYLTYGPAHAHADAVASFRHFRMWAQAPYMIGLATLPIVLGLRSLWAQCRHDCTWLIGCSGASWLASTGLFWLSTDWDRWIYVHTFSTLLVLLPIERRRQELA